MLLGLISEACKEKMKQNLDEVMRTACSGMVQSHVRVRYASLSCTALLLTDLSPRAQKKFHQDMVPQLIKMMSEETLLKMKTHAVSTMINFTRGFLNTDEDEEEPVKGEKILALYSKDLF